MKWKPETEEEYKERMRKFNQAKASYEFYDTGLGVVLPDRLEKR